MACFVRPIQPQTKRTYQVPREVEIETAVRQTFPQYFNTGFPVPLLEWDGFYPIGWSRDGKFAYYVEPVDEACGCYFAELWIQDLRTDKALWKFILEPYARPDKVVPNDNIRRLWRRNQKLFNEKLRRYKIEPLSRFSLLGPTFTVGGKNFSTAVKAKKTNIADYSEDLITNIELDLAAGDLGEKTIYSETVKDVLMLPLLDVGVAGAFKSPFENRAAIVIMRVVRGWEGPPHVVGVSVVGADLKYGFKK
jgi:hypothetical protein